MADPLFRSQQAGRLLDGDVRHEIEQILAEIPLDEGGGASLLKVLVLADLVIARPVIRLVEIGVYRGRLLLPLAHVMERREGGEAFGIDPYLRAASEQHEDHSAINLAAWAAGVDWDGRYREVTQRIERLGLESRCHIVRARSAEAAGRFAPSSIDLLHIDGNHDSAAVLEDAELYVPRVSVGGYVVLDDVSWPSVHAIYEHLYAHHELIFQMFDANGIAAVDPGGNDFAVFRLHGEGGRVDWAPLS